MALGRKPIDIVNDGKHQLLAKASHWERIFLKYVARVQNGFAFSSDYFSKDRGLPLIRIRDINNSTTVDRYNGEYSEEFIVRRGDILIGMDGNFKATMWKGKDGLLNQRVCRILPYSKEFDVKFLVYCLQPFLDAIHAETSSVTVKHISSKTIEEIPLPFPPLTEQQAIVSEIEKLFSSIDKGIENLRTAQAQLKVYRQAVLKWAFEGRLTNDNLRNGELPKGWRMVKTKDIINIINNGYTPSKEFLSEGQGDVPFIKVYNLNFNGTLNFTKNPTFIPMEKHQKDLKRSICFPGDVLINIVGPPLGKVSIVTSEYPEWNINQAIVLFRPNERILSKYIVYFMQNPVTINWLENTSKATAGQWNVKVSTCREIPFPICSVREQQKIIEVLESRLSVADKLEETIAQSLQQAEALKQSILKQAFEGKLVQAEQRTETKAVSFAEEKAAIASQRALFAARIVAACYDDKHFGKTKFQKTLHLAEYYCQQNVDTHYHQFAAGPLDKFIYAFIAEGEHKGWFSIYRQDNMERFRPGAHLQAMLDAPETGNRSQEQKLHFILSFLKNANTIRSELFSTIYAVWNNLLIQGAEPTKKAIIDGVHDWSEQKAKYSDMEIWKAKNVMGRSGLIPVGWGKAILKPQD